MTERLLKFPVRCRHHLLGNPGEIFHPGGESLIFLGTALDALAAGVRGVIEMFR